MESTPSPRQGAQPLAPTLHFPKRRGAEGPTPGPSLKGGEEEKERGGPGDTPGTPAGDWVPCTSLAARRLGDRLGTP